MARCTVILIIVNISVEERLHEIKQQIWEVIQGITRFIASSTTNGVISEQMPVENHALMRDEPSKPHT